MKKSIRKISAALFCSLLYAGSVYAATPLVGDWNGDGDDNPGLFADNVFYLDFDNDGISEITVQMGQDGDLPVCGDWNGDGIDDVGVFRSAERKFYLDTNFDGNAEIMVTIGRSSDIPVVGDWDSDGKDDIGVFRPSERRYYMDFNEDGIHDRAVTIGKLGDYSLVGDWDGDGADSIGIYRPSNKRFYLDDNDDGVHDHAQYYGSTNDVPIVGDWNGDGVSDIGVYRASSSMFHLDEDFDGGADLSIEGKSASEVNVTPFTRAEVSGKTYLVSNLEAPSCTYDISFDASMSYSVENGLITIAFSDGGSVTLSALAREGNEITVLSTNSSGSFVDETNQWGTTFISSFNNNTSALVDWFIANGFRPSASLTADGRVVTPGELLEGSWYVSNNVLYFSVAEDGCLDYKAYKIVNNRLLFATDSAHTEIISMILQ